VIIITRFLPANPKDLSAIDVLFLHQPLAYVNFKIRVFYDIDSLFFPDYPG
jgi:uncharacterized protein YciW